jgi:cytochrome c556
MANHVRDMTDLVSAIMVLDYPTIADRAKGVASDANLARPLGGDATELNALLPDQFFQYQDDLRKNARLLATAAERMDALQVADAYGRVSESCVRCHAVYRGGGR